MKSAKAKTSIIRAEQKALQQHHHRIFRQALRLARQVGRREVT